jgi:hypothetical protein
MTIAKWVGHASPVLIGEVYAHLSNEHAQRAAKKVTFENGGKEPKTEGTNALNPRELSVEELLRMLQEKMTKQ